MKTASELLQQTRLMPLVAILRGLDVGSAKAVGLALYAAGFRTLEVPLNRPGAFQCIELLSKELPDDVLVGGGTMLTQTDVDAVHAAGGRLMVSPNCDARVISHATALGMLCAPGVVTPTEAFAALEAGAHALKLFPSEMVGHGGLKAMKSVLPTGTDFWPVGGITPESMGAWVKAGATGFGIGSQLYAPGTSAAEVLQRGHAFVAAWRVGTPNFPHGV
jgi:2-dehydro-3-deoxyphosphogalactonate aldolase